MSTLWTPGGEHPAGNPPTDAVGAVGDEGDPTVEILWCVHGAGERRAAAPVG